MCVKCGGVWNVEVCGVWTCVECGGVQLFHYGMHTHPIYYDYIATKMDVT